MKAANEFLRSGAWLGSLTVPSFGVMLMSTRISRMRRFLNSSPHPNSIPDSPARNLDRNSVGYEINPEFLPVIRAKLNVGQTDLAGTEYHFLKDEFKTSFPDGIDKLPYIFKDPHKLDKKIDPRKMQFGSRIDAKVSQREEYFTVKSVISPELVRLNNDLVIRLIGVKENPSLNGQAVKYLTGKTKGHKVFLKFDNLKYDENNHLLGYLYLKNKTFLNAHLIKEGLVEVDTSLDFKYKSKFVNQK